MRAEHSYRQYGGLERIHWARLPANSGRLEGREQAQHSNLKPRSGIVFRSNIFRATDTRDYTAFGGLQ